VEIKGELLISVLHSSSVFSLSFSPLVAFSLYLLYPLKHLIKCLSFRQQSSERRAAICLCTLKLHVSIESTWGHKNSSCNINIHIYRVSQEEWTELRESVPYVKLYRYNPKHLCSKLNGYGDKGARKVWSSCGSTFCTWFAWCNSHTLRIVCPCLQLAQARSSLRLHM